MLLLKHKGTVYGTVQRAEFVPSEWLLRLDPGLEPARSLWNTGQFAAQFFAEHGYTITAAQVRRHYAAPSA
jgi:hypothetical protein